jgi:hypothetical protein
MWQTAWRRTLRRLVSVKLSRRVEKVVAYLPLSEMGERQRREFHEALLDVDTFEDLTGQMAGGDPPSGAGPAEAPRRRRD